MVDHPVFSSVWLAMATVTVIYLILVAILFHYLKRVHTSLWNQLGSPLIFWNNSLRNNLLFLRFLLRRDYRTVADPKLTLLATVIFWLFCVCAALFAALFVIFLLSFHPGNSN